MLRLGSNVTQHRRTIWNVGATYHTPAALKHLFERGCEACGESKVRSPLRSISAAGAGMGASAPLGHCSQFGVNMGERHCTGLAESGAARPPGLAWIVAMTNLWAR